MLTQTVKVFINVTQDAESRLYDGEPKFTGAYVLCALDTNGVVLHEVHMTLENLNVPTSDYARLLVLAVALKRLHSKLRNEQADYALLIIQSSNNVDGWLSRGWKRNTDLVKQLAGDVDTLLKPFQRREFVRLPRTALEAATQGKAVMSIQ